MSTKTNQTLSAEKIVSELVSQADMEDRKNRRSESRFPFFRPVSIQMGDHSYSAFTREISGSAIGLMHNMKLELREVEVSFPNKTGQGYKLPVRIEWCEPCGEGWYISGGAFVGISVYSGLNR